MAKSNRLHRVNEELAVLPSYRQKEGLPKNIIPDLFSSIFQLHVTTFRSTPDLSRTLPQTPTSTSRSLARTTIPASAGSSSPRPQTRLRSRPNRWTRSSCRLATWARCQRSLWGMMGRRTARAGTWIRSWSRSPRPPSRRPSFHVKSELKWETCLNFQARTSISILRDRLVNAFLMV